MQHHSNLLALFLAHRGELVSYASGIVGNSAQAEDLVQEAWLRMGTVSGGRVLDEPVGYLYRVVRNLAIDSHRRRSREQRVIAPQADTAADTAVDPATTPETAAAATEEVRRLRRALDELPPRTRIALEMQRFGGCKLREIAAHLDLSITQTHTIIAEGIDHCRRRVRPGT